jgi:hypothetical protein
VRATTLDLHKLSFPKFEQKTSLKNTENHK